jgi:hypothetical protein
MLQVCCKRNDVLQIGATCCKFAVLQSGAAKWCQLQEVAFARVLHEASVLYLRQIKLKQTVDFKANISPLI